MDKFVIEDNFLVLCKSVKHTKPNENGEYKDYYVISLYSKKEDGFEKIAVFDKAIFDKYDIMKNYNMKIEVTFYNNKKRLKVL